MTTAELVERVARAICLECGWQPDALVNRESDDEGDPPSAPQWHSFRDEARAALAAVSLPKWEDMDGHHVRGTDFPTLVLTFGEGDYDARDKFGALLCALREVSP